MQDQAANRWTNPYAILVATDLCDLDRLMPFAMQQAARTGARLILLRVIDARGSPPSRPDWDALLRSGKYR